MTSSERNTLQTSYTIHSLRTFTKKREKKLYKIVNWTASVNHVEKQLRWSEKLHKIYLSLEAAFITFIFSVFFLHSLLLVYIYICSHRKHCGSLSQSSPAMCPPQAVQIRCPRKATRACEFLVCTFFISYHASVFFISEEWARASCATFPYFRVIDMCCSVSYRILVLVCIGFRRSKTADILYVCLFEMFEARWELPHLAVGWCCSRMLSEQFF